MDYLTKLLCGPVSAQFLLGYLCQLKTKKHKQNASKYVKNGREIFFFVCTDNFSWNLTGQSADISLIVIVLVSVLGTVSVYQQSGCDKWMLSTQIQMSCLVFLNYPQSLKALIRLKDNRIV